MKSGEVERTFFFKCSSVDKDVVLPFTAPLGFSGLVQIDGSGGGGLSLPVPLAGRDKEREHKNQIKLLCSWSETKSQACLKSLDQVIIFV